MAIAVVFWVALGTAAATIDDVLVAAIAAMASMVNSYLLIRARQTQKHIGREVMKLRDPVQSLEELSSIREAHIKELRDTSRRLERVLKEFMNAADTPTPPMRKGDPA